MTDNSIPHNLKLLCSYIGNVSECSRQIGINRQQFTKYLSGKSTPSVKNLRKICDFFGVDDDELTLPTETFRQLISSRANIKKSRKALDNSPQGDRHAKLLEGMINQSEADLERYLGDYFYYYMTPSYDGHISKGFARLYMKDGIGYSHFYERAKPEQAMQDYSEVGKFAGLVFVLGERIQIVDYGVHCQRALSHTILYGAAKGRYDLLSGITLGIQGRNSRIPFSARIVFEKTSNQTSLRNKLNSIGLFPIDSGDISPAIVKRLKTPSEIANPDIFTASENF
ncbi:helix-turn-helix domain-containing protein [Vibrio viridaestus]|uniref:XRE family transcriptional regulator n=1 Tax=Vibrio viridaestus TaxID=2487322 RepID=A0A3N9TB05_9VIBR|nr:helix-turn-helix transcriptional regulator [Vibrio viridaestus]RQW61259.1 XRE family transcriptional regulator [Vibrio viridaestus]